MRARRAELILAEPSGIPRRVALNDEGEPVIEPISLDGHSMVTHAILTGRGSLHNVESHQKKPDVDPIVGEYRDAVVAPLSSLTRELWAAALAMDVGVDHTDIARFSERLAGLEL